MLTTYEQRLFVNLFVVCCVKQAACVCANIYQDKIYLFIYILSTTHVYTRIYVIMYIINLSA